MSALRIILVCLALSAALAMAAEPTQNQETKQKNTEKELADRLSNLNTKYTMLTARQNMMTADLDSVWLMINFVVLLVMVPAFAFRELGLMRSTDTQQFIMKYAIIMMVSAVAWWICGYGVSFGDSGNNNRNAFIGNNDYVLKSDGGTVGDRMFATFSFRWAQAVVSMCVFASVLGERVSLMGYGILTAVYTGFIYPIVAHWMWSEAGWLSVNNNGGDIHKLGRHGAFDFAGATVIFVTGAAAALAGLMVVGARKVTKNSNTCMSLVVFGVLLTWFAFYALIAGSTMKMSMMSAAHAAKVTICVTLAAAAGGIGSALLGRVMLTEKAGVFDVSNGMIAGLVAVAGGAGLYEPYAGFLIGLVGGALYILGAVVVEAAGFDDGMRSIAVYFVNGLWGMMATGLWARKDDVVRAFPQFAGQEPIHFGIFYGGGGQVFGVNLVAVLAAAAWSFVMTYVTLYALDRFEVLRLNEVEWENGADFEAEEENDPTKEE